ncbi:C-C motif chemokine 20a.3 [Sparus aurata]|uniref:C-C motif chemokine 20-like n=1 Tax=Sparus aurata TaxID=8175 RepID=A0A671WNY8_SPAAU|nr:C-C motif chemokine 20-like [Sparus aurata]
MVSVKAAAMAIALLTFCVLGANTTSAAYSECCRSYTTRKLPFPAIRGYTVQTIKGVCHINAIIFHYTFDKKKGRACTNPALPWVMDYVDRLRTKAQKVHDQTSRGHK